MMQTQGVRILLADNQDTVRAGLRSMLKDRRSWYVCGEADNGVDAVRLADELSPDVVVLDLDLNEMDGVDATRRIKRSRPARHVLIFTDDVNEYRIRRVLAAGATGFVLKSDGGGWSKPSQVFCITKRFLPRPPQKPFSTVF
ncbi:MAG TPA: response regulator transcription factor [Terriglobia bacterium]|nr:response regulator transcription factor [Terriglobia bacterium]